nr:hypothetical protein [Tanacetum cinerariifolium]GEY97488.1 hypothetical protein [Tanacetum cinerariifolium]
MVKADQPSLMTDFTGLDVAKNNVAGPTSSPNGNTTMKGDLPLASVHEVNDRMENSLYRYFIGKRLAFSGVECDHLVMVVPNLEGSGYTKETIRIEYERKPPRCSICLIFGHSPIDCPKVIPKRVVNQKDKGKGQTSDADDEAKQSSEGASLPRMTPYVGTSIASTSCYNKESPSNKGNTISLSNSFQVLSDENLIVEEVASGSMATIAGTQEEGQSSTHIVDYPDDLGNDDEIEPIDNEMTTFLASNPIGVGYGLKILLEQWRENNLEDHYDPYDDNMYGSRNS